jgi:hypothetical protein
MLQLLLQRFQVLARVLEMLLHLRREVRGGHLLPAR